MKISSVNIKYFKFHQNLTINIKSNNCLIYGENGTGKSSIYEALYSCFYHQKRLDKGINIQESYKNRNFIKDIEVHIDLDNNSSFNRNANHLDNFNLLEVNSIKPTIYFANEKILKRLTKENFYIVIRDTLTEHFPELKELTITPIMITRIELFSTILSLL